MTLRVSNLRLPVDEPEAALPAALARALGLPPGDLLSWRLLRKSLDTRDRHHIQFVYSAEVRVPDEAAVLRHARPRVQVEPYAEPPFEMPPPGERPLAHRPVGVGSGPG